MMEDFSPFPSGKSPLLEHNEAKKHIGMPDLNRPVNQTDQAEHNNDGGNLGLVPGEPGARHTAPFGQELQFPDEENL